MIHQLRMLKPSTGSHALPWASDVPCLNGEPSIPFRPGLNILFGPNGSGKSTVLKLLAMYLAAEQGGRSVVTSSWLRDLFGFMGDQKPGLFWSVEHDGQPVVYSNPRQAIGLFGHGSAFDDDFMMDGLNELQVMKSSSGQTTSARIARVVRMIMEDPGLAAAITPSTGHGPASMARPPRTGKTAKDLKRKPPSRDDERNVFPATIEWREHANSLNSLWKEWLKIATVMLKGSGPAGPRTILLDEPETGFGLPWQAGFWHNVMRSEQATNFQIIVATHSPFALNVPGAHYVETVPGYLDECRSLMTMEFGLPLISQMHSVSQASPGKPADAAQDR